MRPVLVLEINEVPWRLIDRYVSGEDYPNIRKFFECAHQYTSMAVDSGELSPWVTWPTMHRGMSNDEHGVLNLGQDPATFRGKPLWEDFRNKGLTIGLCGPMQSWPPFDPGQGGFYVPDTFAHDSACYPGYLEPLQAINLSQVKKNPRIVSSSMPGVGEIQRLLSCAVRAGIRASTIGRIAAQLVRERFDSSIVPRRPVFQTLLFWDVFRKHYNPINPPAYASFFTNHVAGVMHRYWKDVFPEDFPGRDTAQKASREPLMRFALCVLDDMLEDVLRWAKLNPDIAIIFASSMGQGPVHRDYHEGIELHITNVDALLASAGLTKAAYRPLLAMVPQVAAEIPAPLDRARTIMWLKACTTAAGKPLFDTREMGISVSISITLPPRSEIELGYIKNGTQTIPFTSLGLTSSEIEAGSGYHIAEGSFAVLLPCEPGPTDQERRAFPATRFKRWIMHLVEAERHNPALLFGPSTAS
jgi:hypothetical protein